MNILVTGLWFPLGTNVVIRDALRRSGHSVTTAGPCFGDIIPWGGMMELPGKAQVPDVKLPWLTKTTVPEIQAMTGKAFDLVIQCDPEYYLSGAACPSVIYASDNHVVKSSHIDECNLLFGAHSWGFHSDHEKFRWLSGGREPHAKDLGLERRYDVCMIGTMYEQRADVVKALLCKNITMLLGCGRLWDEWNYLYNLARCAVVEPCNGDLSGRVFNHFAQGCLVVMRAGVKDADKAGIRPFVHYLPYANETEMVEAVKKGRDPHFHKLMTGRAKDWVEPVTWEQAMVYLIKEVSRCGS